LTALPLALGALAIGLLGFAVARRRNSATASDSGLIGLARVVGGAAMLLAVAGIGAAGVAHGLLGACATSAGLPLLAGLALGFLAVLGASRARREEVEPEAVPVATPFGWADSAPLPVYTPTISEEEEEQEEKEPDAELTDAAEGSADAEPDLVAVASTVESDPDGGAADEGPAPKRPGRSARAKSSKQQ
jgi:hypothetical protein